MLFKKFVAYGLLAIFGTSLFSSVMTTLLIFVGVIAMDPESKLVCYVVLGIMGLISYGISFYAYRLLRPKKYVKAVEVVEKKNEIEEKVAASKLGTCPFAEVPDLSLAILSGNVGQGESSLHNANGKVYITNRTTDRVKYYFFEDGTLVFVGLGPVVAVEQGGYDGRREYVPEKAPWPKKVELSTKRLIVTEGITKIGSGILTNLPSLKEINLANSVLAIEYNKMRSLTILRCGERFQSLRGMTGYVEELILPNAPIDLGKQDSLEGIRTNDPKIQALMDDRTSQFFNREMGFIFQEFPLVAKRLVSIPSISRELWYQSLHYFRWMPKYGTAKNVYVTTKEMEQLSKYTKNEDVVKLQLKNTYPFLPTFIGLGVLIYVAEKTNPKHMIVDMKGWHHPQFFLRFWQVEYPNIKLEMHFNDDVYETNLEGRNPYERATRLEKNQILETERLDYFYLSKAKLAPCSTNQEEILIVDYKDFQPYYLLIEEEQCVIKEKVSWMEVFCYASDSYFRRLLSENKDEGIENRGYFLYEDEYKMMLQLTYRKDSTHTTEVVVGEQYGEYVLKIFDINWAKKRTLVKKIELREDLLESRITYDPCVNHPLLNRYARERIWRFVNEQAIPKELLMFKHLPTLKNRLSKDIETMGLFEFIRKSPAFYTFHFYYNKEKEQYCFLELGDRGQHYPLCETKDQEEFCWFVLYKAATIYGNQVASEEEGIRKKKYQTYYVYNKEKQWEKEENDHYLYPTTYDLRKEWLEIAIQKLALVYPLQDPKMKTLIKEAIEKLNQRAENGQWDFDKKTLSFVFKASEK